MFDYKHTAVEELIPHSPPMVLIDKILYFDQTNLEAEISIDQKCKFFDDTIQGVPTWVGMEYMAQAIAAIAGINAKKKNEPVKLGFLLGTRRYVMFHQAFDVGKTYKIQVKQLYMDDSGLASFDCEISENLELLVKARLNVFETDDAQQLIDK